MVAMEFKTGGNHKGSEMDVKRLTGGRDPDVPRREGAKIELE
jgi:hypothetical protein